MADVIIALSSVSVFAFVFVFVFVSVFVFILGFVFVKRWMIREAACGNLFEWLWWPPLR